MPDVFLFNVGDEAVSVSLLSRSSTAVPLQKPARPAEVECVWDTAICSFALARRNLGGRYTVVWNRGFEISTFQIGPLEPTESASPISAQFLSSMFLTKLAVHGGLFAMFTGRWYPPGTKVPGTDRRAGQDGHVIPVRADRGRGRNSERPWNDDAEVRRTADIYNQFAKVNDPTYNPFGTARAREEAVAKRTRMWSASTVHRQLQIARDKGWIIGKTIGTPRKRRKL
jgi:hypothetical protein